MPIMDADPAISGPPDDSETLPAVPSAAVEQAALATPCPSSRSTLVDRLVHRAGAIEIEAESYRLKRPRSRAPSEPSNAAPRSIERSLHRENGPASDTDFTSETHRIPADYRGHLQVSSRQRPMWPSTFAAAPRPAMDSPTPELAGVLLGAAAAPEFVLEDLDAAAALSARTARRPRSHFFRATAMRSSSSVSFAVPVLPFPCAFSPA
ncbi:uncharacterized protein SOCEGT47_051340 [Sorangium cellulosum]|uniref:Uncharacterized protein n=1 Tax=Sorangium cellulosum TaxID=56 RepID=A0A4P2Q5B7_SORCE|nr:uncharacterized protein SOCEGT47_051340 [Sorangium cellulosum]